MKEDIARSLISSLRDFASVSDTLILMVSVAVMVIINHSVSFAIVTILAQTISLAVLLLPKVWSDTWMARRWIYLSKL